MRLDFLNYHFTFKGIMGLSVSFECKFEGLKQKVYSLTSHPPCWQDHFSLPTVSQQHIQVIFSDFYLQMAVSDVLGRVMPIWPRVLLSPPVTRVRTIIKHGHCITGPGSRLSGGAGSDTGPCQGIQ